MDKRGAYFFVIDAFIASSIIIIALMAIFTTRNVRPESGPALSMIEDFANYLQSSKLNEVQGSYVMNLSNSSNITSLDNTILEQAVIFYYYNSSNVTRISQLIDATTRSASSQQRSIIIYLNSTLIYNRSLSPSSSSDLMLTTKRVVFKRMNETFVFGPLIVEVKLWV
ncbi:MAG: hypothetical protein V1866_05260 [archaeon]